MQIKIGEATLVVNFTDNYDDDPFGDGTPGFGGYTEVNRMRYSELYDAYQFTLYSVDEDTVRFDADEHDEDEDISISNGDDFIVFANSVSIEGGEWEITYNGNPYWFFHDLCHAQNDCSGGRIDIDSEGYSEERALIEGAMKAHEHGIGLGVIFGELALVVKPFEERFKRSTDAIERFAEYLENVLTKESV